MFKGSIVALITPFKNNKLDEDCYISLIHHHLKNGTSGLVPAGTTGESPTLNHKEHERVIELCVKESKGKIPVIAGTGSNSTEEAISLTKYAEKIGANAAFVAAQNGHLEVLQYLQEQGCNLNAPTNVGATVAAVESAPEPRSVWHESLLDDVHNHQQPSRRQHHPSYQNDVPLR